jgi:hypothetical protein
MGEESGEGSGGGSGEDAVGGTVENAAWVAEWGDPCRDCGFDWSIAPDAAIAAVEGVLAELAALLDGHTGDETAPDASWSAKAYVFHVADNLYIFAERLEGVAAGAPALVAPYDQDELAAARHYESMSVQAALWSVRASVAVWAPAARASLRRDVTYFHPERGALTAAEITRGPAHDAVHHAWDVRRAVQSSSPLCRPAPPGG